MTKQELIDRVFRSQAQHQRLTRKATGELIDATFAALGGYFVRARVTKKETPRFTWPGFGTFTKKQRNSRTGRDPRSGTPIEIPARLTVGFAPGVEMRQLLNPKPASKKGKVAGDDR